MVYGARFSVDGNGRFGLKTVVRFPAAGPFFANVDNVALKCIYIASLLYLSTTGRSVWCTLSSCGKKRLQLEGRPWFDSRLLDLFLFCNPFVLGKAEQRGWRVCLSTPTVAVVYGHILIQIGEGPGFDPRLPHFYLVQIPFIYQSPWLPLVAVVYGHILTLTGRS